MARSVLIFPHALAMATLLALDAGVTPPAPAPAVTCAGDLSGASEELRRDFDGVKQRIEADPLFQAVVRAHGPARKCTRRGEEGALRLSYQFAKGGAFEASIDPQAESERHTATLKLSAREAREVLRQAEHAQFGAQGCGIQWDKPEEEPPETVFRGDTCNCQARLATLPSGSVRLVLSSAC